ncbi:MAG TPA: CpsD/CapB family tyrosine-protein kinase [Terriglobales bacterium]|nr:CpsD/CapB family tyrosine-protein kinase [Terriglobales bacterium]
MSHIFEALQRAEAERSGGSVSKTPDSVAELLDQTLAKAGGGAESASNRQSFAGALGQEGETFSAAQVLSPVPAADSRLVCLTDQGSLAAEKFRVLGLRLRNLREKRKLKRIVVTSTIPEEGKSLTAANLALNQARSKVLKTLLIDGDLRRPTLAGRFGLRSSLPGLAECLLGERPLSEVVYKFAGTNLWFLPSGIPPENPLDLMQSGQMADVLDRLGNFFDWVIIDAPPLIPLADTTYWMKQCDGVLMVVREGVTEKKPLKRALEIVDRAALLGVVVNSCSSSDHKNYYQRYGKVSGKPGDVPGAENE